MGALGIEDFPIGSLVMTPTGRIGVIIKHIWGDRDNGDFPRCLVRYFDSVDRRECARLQPNFLRLMIPAKVFVPAINSWRRGGDDEDDETE